MLNIILKCTVQDHISRSYIPFIINETLVHPSEISPTDKNVNVCCACWLNTNDPKCVETFHYNSNCNWEIKRNGYEFTSTGEYFVGNANIVGGGTIRLAPTIEEVL